MIKVVDDLVRAVTTLPKKRQRPCVQNGIEVVVVEVEVDTSVDVSPR